MNWWFQSTPAYTALLCISSFLLITKMVWQNIKIVSEWLDMITWAFQIAVHDFILDKYVPAGIAVKLSFYCSWLKQGRGNGPEGADWSCGDQWPACAGRYYSGRARYVNSLFVSDLLYSFPCMNTNCDQVPTLDTIYFKICRRCFLYLTSPTSLSLIHSAHCTVLIWSYVYY